MVLWLFDLLNASQRLSIIAGYHCPAQAWVIVEHIAYAAFVFNLEHGCRDIIFVDQTIVNSLSPFTAETLVDRLCSGAFISISGDGIMQIVGLYDFCKDGKIGLGFL